MARRGIVCESWDEYNKLKLTDKFKADFILVRLKSSNILYYIAKSKHSVPGRVVKMEVV